MEKVEKKIYRDEIYVGIVTEVQVEVKNYFGMVKTEIFPQTKLRNVLFNLNEYGLANDLLYASPNYSILNLQYGVSFWNLVNEAIVNQENYGELIWHLSENYKAIQEAYNLGPLLQYQGLDSEVNFKEVQEVYHNFMKNFAKNLYEFFPTLEERNRFQIYENISFKPAKEEGPIRKLKRWQ